MRVWHCTGTAKDKAPGGIPWIEYWRQQTNLPLPVRCPCNGDDFTDNNPVVGAHVEEFIEYASSTKRKFIVPTCHKCNVEFSKSKAHSHTFEVDDNMLVDVPED